MALENEELNNNKNPNPKNEIENIIEEDLKNDNTNDLPDAEKIVEEVKERLDEELSKEDSGATFKPSDTSMSTKHRVFKILENTIYTIIAIVVLLFTIFTITNVNNSNIASGVSILGIDVSGLNKSDAIRKVTNRINANLSNDIVLKHNDFETNISSEQLEVTFDIESAVDDAFITSIGNNAFSNSFKKLSLIIKPTNILPDVSINEEQLDTSLNDISTQLPDAVIQSTYYIDNNNLVITSGKPGVIIDSHTMKNTIINKIHDLSYINAPIDIATIFQEPEQINIESIYKEIRKDPKDAYYDAQTHVVYPEENGLDFNISLEEAQKIAEVGQDEYSIPLKTLQPNVTTNMIGMEAFPDLLSSFSTKYIKSNRDRTTNLILASNKVNGTVVLPGETFSYNSTVGERTIAAGYKEAAIYKDGQVINGLGGGICQISTTLYNAALYANLEIVERRNHQFVPSYANAGRDATVVYGSQDFKFKNNRNYAIKIVSSVNNGVAKFEIYGLRESNDYEVVISSNITSRTANSLTSATYKTLKQDGQVVWSGTISRDTYKVH